MNETTKRNAGLIWAVLKKMRIILVFSLHYHNTVTFVYKHNRFNYNNKHIHLFHYNNWLYLEQRLVRLHSPPKYSEGIVVMLILGVEWLIKIHRFVVIHIIFILWFRQHVWINKTRNSRSISINNFMILFPSQKDTFCHNTSSAITSHGIYFSKHSFNYHTVWLLTYKDIYFNTGCFIGKRNISNCR